MGINVRIKSTFFKLAEFLSLVNFLIYNYGALAQGSYT